MYDKTRVRSGCSPGARLDIKPQSGAVIHVGSDSLDSVAARWGHIQGAALGVGSVSLSWRVSRGTVDSVSPPSCLRGLPGPPYTSLHLGTRA